MQDLTGQKFIRLTVLKKENDNPKGRLMWLCSCDCGVRVIVLGSSLQNGNTKSCGCLAKQKTIKRQTKHGHNKRKKVSKTYTSWTSMIQRCTNVNNRYYHIYGERGIRVCRYWMKFKNFLEDMGKAPKGHQIDRIDNDGNYCKSNCRWVTAKQQQRNKSNNRMITYNGKTQCLAAWAEEVNISTATLWKRLGRGWSMGKALTTPVQKRRK